MTIFRNLPAELLGLFVLFSAVLVGIFFPEVSEFWMALATAITLFVIMHIKTKLVLDVAAKEKPSP